MTESLHPPDRANGPSPRLRQPERSGARTVAGLAISTALAFGGVALAPWAASAAEPDATPPDLEMTLLNEPNALGWFSEPAELLVGATDAESGLDAVYLRDEKTGVISVWTSGQITREYPEDGPRTLEAWATDKAGNVSDRARLSFKVDRTGPTVTVTTPTVVEQGSIVPMDFFCNDNLSDIALCDGDYSDGQPLDTSQTGTFRTGVWARDNADNLTQIDFEYTVRPASDQLPTIDFSLAPTLPQSGWFNGPVDLTLTGSFPLGPGGVIYYATGAITENRGDAGSTKTHTFDSEGVTEFKFVARDAENNESDPKFFTLRIDRTAPTVTGAADGDRQSIRHVAQGERVQFAPVCNDALSGIASCSAVGVTDGLLDTSRAGEVTVALSASDRAGNTATGEYRYVVDPAPAETGAPSPSPSDGATPPENPAPNDTAATESLALTGANIPASALWGSLAALIVGGGLLGLRAIRAHRANRQLTPSTNSVDHI